MGRKVLTVGRLKEELSKYNDDLPVMIYAFEDGSFAYEVTTEEIEKQLLYFKADHPFSYCKIEGKKVTRAICIKGELG